MPEKGEDTVSLRDHDYFETLEGWVFLVLGDVHPDGRVWSCLKYVPGDGLWGNGEKRFVRVFRRYTVPELLDLIKFVEEREPSYVYHDPTVNAKVIAPPTDRIKSIFSSRKRLAELMAKSPNDRLANILISLVELLSEYSGVPKSYFGVTGSILLGIHHKDSDIDLVVYDVENVWRVLEAVQELRREGKLYLLKDVDPSGWAARASAKYPLPHDSLLRLASKVLNKGRYAGVDFSIHGVREKPARRYGEVTYTSLGMAKARVRVVDVSESLFTPAVYYVEDGVYGVDRIACYDMMLAGVLREGDSVEVYGKLEAALRDGEEVWRQILVGSYEGAGREYIRIL
ncbi:MAG: hypothetical protein RMJ28_05990 [Nitrososphaerota archaeon]|nr:hypothetical protein [Candidatus Calditenuaceae archaeon]MDW8073764.1 hypothetical protein [Nitrososphaerota archaeon]